MKHSRAAFTLIEITLAIAIALIVFAVAIPAISAIAGDDPLEESFRDFDKFVRQAQSRALAEHRDFLLIWQKDGITLEPRVPSAEDGEGEVDMYSANGAEITLERPAALEKKPSGEWPIWRSGACEPVRISYKRDGLGFWVAEYDPLTARSRLITLEQE
jgi:type II secretory pathway pseudopilin PulG